MSSRSRFDRPERPISWLLRRLRDSAAALLPALLVGACCCPCPPDEGQPVPDFTDVVPHPKQAEPEAAEPEAAKPPPPSVAKPTWPSALKRTMKEGHAPTPYTATQIRDASPTGRETRFRLEAQGAPKMVQVFRFHDSDAAGTVLEVEVLDPEGNVLSPARRLPKQPWSALQSHASYPAVETVITEEQVETAGGTFDCFLYTVTRSGEGPERVDRYWFAKSLPGPPVLMRSTVDDEVVATMELVSHEVK